MSILRSLAVHWLVLAVALAITAWLVPSIEISGGVLGLIAAAAVLGLVNTLVGPVLRLLSLPVTLVTFGLFSLVVNAVLLSIAAGLSDSLAIGGPVGVFIAAMIISVLNAIGLRAAIRSE